MPRKRTYPPQAVGEFFLDSGAHSLYNEKIGHSRLENDSLDGVSGTEKMKLRKISPALFRKTKEGNYDFYNTEEFWAYVDEYCQYVKENKYFIDYYVSVDVLFNPERSWDVWRYIQEKHGLDPVPVVHYGTNVKWVEKYLDAGCKYLGIGGIGQEQSKQSYISWADQVFSIICNSKTKKPLVKTHGFAMTGYELLVRYPWYSVDSASWAKAAAFGRIYVPKRRNGIYCFSTQPYTMSVSHKSPSRKKRGRNVLNLSNGEQRVIREWVESVGVPFGELDDNGEEKVRGIITHHAERKIANMRYYEALLNWLPNYPRIFKHIPRKGFLKL